jgi:hypothetical protein
MSIKEFLFGGKDKYKQLKNMSPGQNQLFNQLISLLSGGGQGGGGLEQSLGLLQQYLDPESDVYKNFEQPYMQQFNEQTVPMLAERFAGYGGGMGGGLSSSGFGQSLGAAGSQLQTNLAQMKSGMQRQSINDILGLTQNALSQQPFSYAHQQASPGFLPQAVGSAVGAFARGGF